MGKSVEQIIEEAKGNILITVWVPRWLKIQFWHHCQEEGLPASAVFRRMMTDFVEANPSHKDILGAIHQVRELLERGRHE